MHMLLDTGMDVFETLLTVQQAQLLAQRFAQVPQLSQAYRRVLLSSGEGVGGLAPVGHSQRPANEA